MRICNTWRSACLGVVTAAMSLQSVAAHADTGVETMKFSVMRDGTQIGTNTIDVVRRGAETSVQIVTHVLVGMAFITLYRFDQTETESWTDGHLLAMNTVTDDNGTVHRMDVSSRDGALVVDGDGQVQKMASSVIPASLWNTAMLGRNMALNPEDGKLVPLSVVDRGEDDLVIDGRTARAHHYMVKTIYAEDVWYDDNDRLVKLELKGSDGSTIQYQLT